MTSILKNNYQYCKKLIGGGGRSFLVIQGILLSLISCRAPEADNAIRISIESPMASAKTVSAADGITGYRLTVADDSGTILDSGMGLTSDFILTDIMPGMYEITAYGYASDGIYDAAVARSTETMTLEKGGEYNIALDDPIEGKTGEIRIEAIPPYSGVYPHDRDTLTIRYIDGRNDFITLSTAEGTLIYEGDGNGVWHYSIAAGTIPSGNAIMTLSVTSADGNTAERIAMAVLLPELSHVSDEGDFDFREGKEKLPIPEFQQESIIVGLQQYRLMNADDYPEDAKLAVIILTRLDDDTTPVFHELSTPIPVPTAAVYIEAYVTCSGYLDSDRAVLLDKTDMLEIPDPIVLSTAMVPGKGEGIIANRDEYLYIMYSNGLHDAKLQFSFYEENGSPVWQDSPIHAGSTPTADNPSVTSSARVRIVSDGKTIAESNTTDATRTMPSGTTVRYRDGFIIAQSEAEGYNILIWPEHNQFDSLNEGELFLPSYDPDDCFRNVFFNSDEHTYSFYVAVVDESLNAVEDLEAYSLALSGDIISVSSENGYYLIELAVNTLRPEAHIILAYDIYTGKYEYTISISSNISDAVSCSVSALEGDRVVFSISEEYLIENIAVTLNGKELEITDNGDGSYSFTMPQGNVTIEAKFSEITVPMALPDGSVLFYDRGEGYGEYHIDANGYPARDDGLTDDGSGTSTNWRYLICDKSDLGDEALWGPGAMKHTPETGIGYGSSNTDTMIELYPNNYIWDDVQLKRGDTGFNWFVPSKDELNLVYLNKDTIVATGGDNFQSSDYWSSTSSGLVDCQNFATGSQSNNTPGIMVENYCRLLRRI